MITIAVAMRMSGKRYEAARDKNATDFVVLEYGVGLTRARCMKQVGERILPV